MRAFAWPGHFISGLGLRFALVAVIRPLTSRLSAGEEVAGAGGRVQEHRVGGLRVQPQAGLGELDRVLVADGDRHLGHVIAR